MAGQVVARFFWQLVIAYKIATTFVSGNGVILTSPNGITWTTRSFGTSIFLRDVTYGNGRFVTVGSTLISTSPDGITWTARDSGTTSPLYSVTYGGSSFSELFVAVGFCPKDSNDNCTGNGVIVTSPNGSILDCQRQRFAVRLL